VNECEVCKLNPTLREDLQLPAWRTFFFYLCRSPVPPPIRYAMTWDGTISLFLNQSSIIQSHAAGGASTFDIKTIPTVGDQPQRKTQTQCVPFHFFSFP
jgi:enoyl reductase-like protein